MIFKLLLMIAVFAAMAVGQVPAVEPGVSLELAKWRAARYSDVRYKLNLTLEKMSPVLKGTMEIRVKVSEPTASSGGTASNGSEPGAIATGLTTPIILDWRKIRGSEALSTISKVSLNGETKNPVAIAPGSDPAATTSSYEERDEHLIFHNGVVAGENVIKLDFTSPILTSGSAITRYIDKEDGSEYIYSLFVPSDASTAFPAFDQPDLKARFSLTLKNDWDWKAVSNTPPKKIQNLPVTHGEDFNKRIHETAFEETKPISTYVFAFAAGPFRQNSYESGDTMKSIDETYFKRPADPNAFSMNIFVRKSQAAKFNPHAAEVFRLHQEGIKFLESYFDYKFPFPKYDVVLIPEFPFGGMEHAGATFLREASVIFPQEPTKNDYINRSTLIFHEAAHQWFGDTVTMRWFDDLWLKEGFATFMGYKALEKVMPEYNAWKVFYERVKQAAYQTDSTKGTTPIYQEIKNLSAAKSAYGNIVYNKAPAFLRQAEFYLGEDKFQTAVRAFLKKHEYANAGWGELVDEFENAAIEGLKRSDDFIQLPDDQKKLRVENLRFDVSSWAKHWVKRPGLAVVRSKEEQVNIDSRVGSSSQKFCCGYHQQVSSGDEWPMKTKLLTRLERQADMIFEANFQTNHSEADIDPDYAFTLLTASTTAKHALFIFPNYKDYGYGIFLLDPKSRDYVLKNIGNEKDDFLRSMMWGALWDSVREAEMDPREYVELVIKNLSVQSSGFSRPNAAEKPAKAGTQNGETDESTIQTLLGRVSTAMRYYIDTPSGSEPPASAGGTNSNANAMRSATTKRSTKTRPIPPANAGGSDSLQTRLETLLIDRMQNAPTPGQKITYYRSFLSLATSDNARRIMKEILKKSAAARASVPPAVAGGLTPSSTKSVAPNKSNPQPQPRATAGGTDRKSDAPAMSVTTKDKFDIVSRLIILGDPDAPKLLAELEKTETSDDAKRYAYAAKAGFGTAENKAKYWNDFVNNKDISESWIEAAFGPFNNVRHSSLTLPYLERALASLPDHKRNRKIFFVNGWLGAFIGGQKSEEALKIVNKFLADNPSLDKDLRLKILENADVIERAVKIRAKY